MERVRRILSTATMPKCMHWQEGKYNRNALINRSMINLASFIFQAHACEHTWPRELTAFVAFPGHKSCALENWQIHVASQYHRMTTVHLEGRPDLCHKLQWIDASGWSLYHAAAALVSGVSYALHKEHFAVPGDVFPLAQATQRCCRVPCTDATVPVVPTCLYLPFNQNQVRSV